MDETDMLGLEFLDVSGISEAEKQWLQSFLRPNETQSWLPWYIGDRKPFPKAHYQKNKVQTANLPDSRKKVVESQAPNVFFGSLNNSPPMLPPGTVVLPIPTMNSYVNMACSPVTILNPNMRSPVMATFHNHSIPIARPSVPILYTTTSPMAAYPVHPAAIVTNNNSYQEVTYSTMPSQPRVADQFSVITTDGCRNSTVEFARSNCSPVNSFDEKNGQILATDTVSQRSMNDSTPVLPTISGSSHSNTINLNQANTDQIQESAEEKLENHSSVEVKTESVKPQPTNKSWASLFNSKQSSEAKNLVNGTEKLNQPTVIKETTEAICPIKNPHRVKFVDPECYRMGEYLETYKLDGRTISLQPRGLINQSNYCYINSILQALIACPPVYNLLNGLSENITSNSKRKPTPVIDSMCKFVKEFNRLPDSMRVRRSDGKNQQKKEQALTINTDIPFEPCYIYKMLNGIRTDLIEGRQEDAEEFLGLLLNNLNDEMLELIKLVKDDKPNEENTVTNTDSNHSDWNDDKEWQTMGPKNKGSITRRTEFEKTPINDIFGGFLRSRIHRTGDHVTENIQPFYTLQLNIEKVKTVKEALEALTAKYALEGLTSSKTNQEVEAWQQVMLDELPVILILHLKCFDFQLDGCTKIIKALEFPIDLKIDTKLLSSKTATLKEKQYKLFAIVYHDGKEASKGHYTTDAFHVGYSSWVRYDDTIVKPVQEDNVLKPQGSRVPYLLFYRRCDTIRAK